MASVTAVRLRDRVADVVSSSRRRAFLSELAGALVIANRAAYPPHSTDAYRRLENLICVNEMLEVLTSQLRSDFGDGRGGYPDQALIESLMSRSSAWHCQALCSGALQASVAHSKSGWPSRESQEARPVESQAVYALGSANRAKFLTDLFLLLTESAKSIQVTVNPEIAPHYDDIVCHNDLLRHVATHLHSDRDPELTQSSQFVGVLIGSANAGGCGGRLRYAFERALARVESRE